jgi:hypothetical protein
LPGITVASNKTSCVLDEEVGIDSMPSVNRDNSMYSKLSNGSHTIRLIRILPGCWSEAIACELFQASLGIGTPYKALSYAWKCDDKSRKVHITCNHSSVEIGINLYYFLRQLRNAEVPVVIWVDYLCINQQDAAERSHQVAMMREIYENSREVIIWLGEREEKDDFGEWWRDQPRLQQIQTSAAAKSPMSQIFAGKGKSRNEEGLAPIEWYDDERDLPKVNPYVAAFREMRFPPPPETRDIYGAFCTIHLLSQGEAPADIHFLRHLSLASGVVQGIWALMDKSWV